MRKRTAEKLEVGDIIQFKSEKELSKLCKVLDTRELFGLSESIILEQASNKCKIVIITEGSNNIWFNLETIGFSWPHRLFKEKIDV